MAVRNRLLAVAAVLAALLPYAAAAQTPVVAEYPSLVSPTSGAPSYAQTVAPIASGAPVAAIVLKAAPAAVYSVTASNVTASGFLVLVNSATTPGGGASITPLACAAVAAGGTVTISYAPGPPAAFNIGVVAGLTTSASGCYTFTTTTGFISGMVQ